ncbi:hypothetical protein EVB32_132 [Rhizobium phage RHph_TM39]|uniref:Uncharacterized protein n=1 Tax=Rhizobium phage RHph_TM30 TaxID=2509764 RepID=A0A7S5REP9_9CAUD|nr:hypothetical protein PQC16_gp132 [Rhizobium phage RHph_TM30]QIG71603.1 hypothetical protein EVB94_132 [Rhizobium phage RHph_TM40]QIG71966.1 hypothetical protein EVB95_132 [Rhizobium phage RHph_TM2_3B]QIG72328.1 hypothetical protein EVB96_132 [Rhizobium phage RHph_TM3_3_6]QIG77120.1 hypothetical protein EVB32_132 [Rhizobium phage RHph_TM39]QIG77456.1 hypothetical protein EVB61_128 [Rhizobium phage RHph_TM21B]QIG77718.1 hypothetical protein EVB64_131 [Rhizobium phage RHph_TM61]
MNDLIESLQIFSKYFRADSYAPIHCEHDILMLCVADVEVFNHIDHTDANRVIELGWHWSNEFNCWCSFRFGSC